jgi:toxin FitB
VSGFLLDTNIPSELIRTRSDLRVGNWVYARDEHSLYPSVVTIGELRRGFVLRPASRRRTELVRWLENDLLPRLHGRVLPITHCNADRWGGLDGECRWKGTPLVTNVKDFASLGVVLLNPWEAERSAMVAI